MNMSRARQVAAFFIIFIALFTLTGCNGDTIPYKFIKEVSLSLNGRINDNISILDEMEDCGLISKEERDNQANEIKENYQRVLGVLTPSDGDTGEDASVDVKALTQFLPAIVGWQVGNPDTTLTGMIDTYWDAIKGDSTYDIRIFADGPGSSKDEVDPIIIVDYSDKDEGWLSAVNLPIYVLKSDESSGQYGTSIARIVADVSKLQNPDLEQSEIDEILTTYFEQASGITEDGITQDVLNFLDLADPDGDLIQASRGSSLTVPPSEEEGASSTDYGSSTNKIQTRLEYGEYVASHEGNEHQTAIDLDESYFTSVDKNSSGEIIERPGVDMLITQSGEDVIRVRFQEFNSSVWQRIKDTMGTGGKRYYVTGTGVYLMEYPVGYIEGFRPVAQSAVDTPTTYEPVITNSDLSVNIYTGKVLKRVQMTSSDGSKTNDSIEIEPIGAYLSTGDGTSDTCSFAMYGKTKAPDTSLIAGDTNSEGDGNEGDAADTANDLVQNSLIQSVNNEMMLSLGYGENKVYLTVPRIILTDYLEATYSPGVVGSDPTLNVACFGRMIRFDTSRLCGYIDDINTTAVAYYIPMGGETPTEKNILYLSDFCDIKALLDGPQSFYKESESAENEENYEMTDCTMPYLKYFASDSNTSPKDNEDRESALVDKLKEEWNVEGADHSSPENIADLEQVEFNGYPEKFVLEDEGSGASDEENLEIHNRNMKSVRYNMLATTFAFPGAELDKQDMSSSGTYQQAVSSSSPTPAPTASPDNDTDDDTDEGSSSGNSGYLYSSADKVKMGDTRPLLYAIAIRKNIGESGLINWITSDESEDSLKWWSGWLKDNKFSYSLNLDSLSNLLNKNYQFELNDAGIVTLDLNTIAMIQEIMNQEDRLDTSHSIRTFFKVLGYILIGYGVLLLLCYAFDIGVDFGFSLTEKATFGKFIAVADSTGLEPPSSDGAKASYVGFTKILITSMVLMSIGVLFVFVDIIQIVMQLVSMAAGLAERISNFVGGML